MLTLRVLTPEVRQGTGPILVARSYWAIARQQPDLLQRGGRGRRMLRATEVAVRFGFEG